MSTLTSTAIYGTPNQSIAPTQNTAPVFEFRCLYTHDLRKKRKVWQDGSLRFHTFNQRVMVWDAAKNYIGDVFLGKNAQVQEGDELRLDKGVLIDVAEALGRTETDLAPILDRRRPDAASSPARPSPQRSYMPPSSRPFSQGTQVRPKSLAAVLGASRGPIGRATLPSQSPFEQRQQQAKEDRAAEDRQPVPRPAKRQKLSSDVHAQPDRGDRLRGRIDYRALATTSVNVRPAPTAGRRSPKRLDAMDVTPASLHSSQPRLSCGPMSTMPMATRSPPSKPPNKVLEARSTVLPSDSTREALTKRSQTAKGTSAETNVPLPRLAPCRVPEPEAQIEAQPPNLLQFSKKPPRQKLMYRDLLPQKSVTRSRSAGLTGALPDALETSAMAQQRRVQERLNRAKGRDDALRSMNEANPLSMALHRRSLEGSNSAPSVDGRSNSKTPTNLRSPRITSQRRMSIVTAPLHPMTTTDTQDSPLFVHESPLASAESSSFDIPDLALPTAVPPALASSTHLSPETSCAGALTASDNNGPSSINYAPNPAECTSISHHDMQALPPFVLISRNPFVQKELQRIPLGGVTKTRPFRRVHSENDAEGSTSPPPPVEPLLPVFSPSVAVEPVAPPKSPAIARPSPRLRKSISDMTGLSPKQTRKATSARTGAKKSSPAIEEQPVDTDLGAWSTEAAWLFEWWPLDREKPARPRPRDDESKGVSSEEDENGNGQMTPGKTDPRCARGFQSAGRAFLSDRIEAL